MAEKNSLNAWYLSVDSIGGAAVKFPLGGIFPRGGSLLCGYSWAISSNSGLYETCVFITDQGEIAFYDGDGPAAANWTLKGVYRISKPLGRNCLMKAGGDVAVMTEDGIIPLSSVMELDQIALQNKAVTLPIAPAWRTLVQQRTAISGWSITLWPLESMAIITVPSLSVNDKQQLVANARSGAWARYTGWDAKCFAVFGNNLFYGTSDGRVMQAETGGQDDGQFYTAVCAWSFSDLGAKSNRKQITLMRPNYSEFVFVRPVVSGSGGLRQYPKSCAVRRNYGVRHRNVGHGEMGCGAVAWVVDSFCKMESADGVWNGY